MDIRGPWASGGTVRNEGRGGGGWESPRLETDKHDNLLLPLDWGEGLHLHEGGGRARGGVGGVQVARAARAEAVGAAGAAGAERGETGAMRAFSPSARVVPSTILTCGCRRASGVGRRPAAAARAAGGVRGVFAMRGARQLGEDGAFDDVLGVEARGELLEVDRLDDVLAAAAAEAREERERRE